MRIDRKLLRAWSKVLFPEQDIFVRRLPLLAQTVALIILAVAFAGIGQVIPANGFFAYDWLYAFHGHTPFIPSYPPWTELIVAALNWPALVGLTLAAVCLAIYQRSAHPASGVFALLALPVFWTIFLGQLDGLVVLGLFGLPWLMPLALLKPHVSVFALGARPSYVVGGLVALGLSVIIWGLWPLRTLNWFNTYAQARGVQDISLKGWGLPLAVCLLWWSRGDMDLLMAAGCFATPYLIPYNLLPLVPAIARLRPRAAALACAFSWLPLCANWLGQGGWSLGWLFIGFVWLGLAAARYPQARLSGSLRCFMVG